ncbi:beta-N-acetylhexosaminidase [Clostridium sp. CM028]|uniref:beta-N-acetylhexosaminidase n=1 Tax=Clostridium TaxID=1485 RepID=UPI0013EEB7D3|nr:MULTISPECIES: beta-N-acetylhexosaminidase [Clostridium]MBU3091928.1 beta-N-acetylhexosaminidase [Clostridium sp. CF011]MBW9145701.1 beta-N-acetylhexosaminidase [Clostridium sp. CM027]MBW9149551.1 beta-N-acetylhexosaminidase [Clostridium sp. CM028]MBZ9608085.1 beta-N-acetylhexosaminidase [Clostridium estertheticum]UVE41449.1 beta-N-acetylhexosaminidase [Clostridium sp. CM027]
MKKLVISILLIGGLFLSGCSNSNSNLSPNINSKDEVVNPKPENIDVVQNKIDAMSLDDKIGQLVIVGLDGYTMNNNINNLIKDHKVGGFILFRNNVATSNQLVSLINSLKTTNSQNKTPLFISVDEEGGRVSRIPNEIKKLPSNQVIGEKNDGALSYNIGKIIAEELKTFGFNMNFAPVLDINSNPNNPVIGDRAFGSTTDIVNKLGIKTMEGMIDNNIIPVVKHFPGHGDTSVDSHVGLPVVNKDLTKLNAFELTPFNEAIKNNVDAIMVSHILLNKIDSVYPASMSKVIITDILRGTLKFSGVVITDDMTMAAITKYNDIGDAAVKSFNAGSDIILVCHEYDNELKVINSLKAAVQNNVISENRLNESVYRILKLKEKYIINNAAISSINIHEINNKIENLLKE